MKYIHQRLKFYGGRTIYLIYTVEFIFFCQDFIVA